MPQRDGQSGTPRTPHRCVLVARRDPSGEPSRHCRVRDDPRAPDQDWCTRDRAHRAYSRPPANQLPGSGIVPNRCTRPHAVRSMSRGASRPKRAADRGRSIPTRCTARGITPIQPVGLQVCSRSTDRKNVSRRALLRLEGESSTARESYALLPLRATAPSVRMKYRRFISAKIGSKDCARLTPIHHSSNPFVRVQNLVDCALVRRFPALGCWITQQIQGLEICQGR
jgi:hypothetical protein